MQNQEVIQEMAADLRRMWLEDPCWLKLAQKLSDIADGVRAADCRCDEQEQGCTFGLVEEMVRQSLGGPSDQPEENFRILKEGETLEVGDEVNIDGKWYSIGKSSAGPTICSADSAFCPQGYYRRPLCKDKILSGQNFGWALEQIRAGVPVRRSGWNGKGMWIGLQMPGAYSKMTRPYIYMCTVDHNLVPWVASQTDLLAEDWEVADD